jgi:hypothetical protein
MSVGLLKSVPLFGLMFVTVLTLNRLKKSPIASNRCRPNVKNFATRKSIVFSVGKRCASRGSAKKVIGPWLNGTPLTSVDRVKMRPHGVPL